MTSRTFTAMIEGSKATAYVVMPFDPDEVWGARPRHLLHGTINGHGFRGGFDKVDGEWRASLGPAWRRDQACRWATPSRWSWRKSPQREAVDPDIGAALDASPKAAARFDGLAQFYRKAFLRWIDGTKKWPDERVRRIAEMVRLLEEGKKTRD